jgi:type IV pilus assembly protein PilM
MSSAQSSIAVSPVPARPLSASLKCSVCNIENRADRQFCAGCGARLWEPCLQCGQSNAAAEKHCGACGVNLAHELRQAQAAVETQLAEAARLADEYRHPEAIDRLQAVQIADHSALAPMRQAKTDRIAALRSEMLSCNRQRDAGLARARELLAACNYEQAALALEQTAEPYRTEELRQLLDEVRAKQVDLLTLMAEIRQAMAEKHTDRLLPKVEALLRLKPDHLQARALAERLRPLEHKQKLNQRDAIYKAAKAYLARHDYAAALESLQQISDDVRTSQLVRLIDETQAKAAETAWLTRDLREAVAYDEHLLPIAERLAQLRPRDAEAASFIDRLRISRGALAPGFLSQPPAGSVWGPPLETIAAFQRIDASSLDSPHFKSSPDRFCVAAGLALQGLERALLKINLVPPEKKAGLLSLLKTKKKPVTSAWGIDVGRAAIRAIRLSVRADDERVVADAAEYVEHARMLNAPDADVDATFRETLDKVCQCAGFRDAPLCISLPAQKVLFRPIALPLVDEKRLAELMKFEAREQVPIPIDNVVWGYQLLGHRPTEHATVHKCDVALLALKCDDAQTAIAPFTERGLKVELLSSDAAALFNFVMFECDAPRSQAPPGNALPRGSASCVERDALGDSVTAILDVGTDSSNLIITDGARLVIRSIPLGGNSLSRTMVKEFQLTFAQAERVKRTPTAVRELHRLYGALEPRFADLARELRRTIDGFLRAVPASRLARFVVTGGGLKLHGALGRLWHGQ